jgi:predicted nucleic acid-binding protein
MARLIVLDASALIALYGSRDVHHNWAVDLFMKTVDRELAIPALTFAEVLVRPIQVGKVNEFQRSIEKLGLRVLPLDADASVALATLRASTGLKMPDAVVLHSAKASGAALATTDLKLAAAAREHGVPVFAPSN